ncbi:MAG: copper homeostasis protein CutC [Bacteroidota bacterium]
MLLEIACFTPESVTIAASAGADRIEFCDDADTGGLTPSIDDFIELKKSVTVPLFVMLRPRAGDFVYTEEEVDQLYLELETFAYYEADGFVFGALDAAGMPDTDACRTLVSAANGIPCTFHRAFDEVSDWKTAMDTIISCGFSRILTSGKPGSAPQNAALLSEMQEYTAGRIIVLPGGGVRSSNITQLDHSVFSEFHSSAITATSNGRPDPQEISRLKAALSPFPVI